MFAEEREPDTPEEEGVPGEPGESAPPEEEAAAPQDGAPGPEIEGAEALSAADDELIAEAEAVAAREPEVGEAHPAKPEAPAEAAAPEGARLLALKMALDGRPREETAAYLRENFELTDFESLLDEVYARVGS